MKREEFLQMEGIRKEFPGVVANDDVDLSVRKGEVHGLLGENGAGKSTLMKTLYGLYTQDEGDIFLNGEKLSLESPQDAIDAGIGMVHQHFMLIPRFSVAQNIVLGMREPAKLFRPDNDYTDKSFLSNSLIEKATSWLTLGLDVPQDEIQSLAEQYGFSIDASTPVWKLDVGQRQRVEILKALYRDVDLLILDEPTAVLTPREADQLFETLDELTDEGLSVILITHKLREIQAITDRVTVLRDGTSIGTVVTEDVDRNELVRMMVGRDVMFDIDNTGRPSMEGTILEAEQLRTEDERGVEVLSGVDLTVEKGEIVGIAGVSGNGGSELAQSIAGVRPLTGGNLTVDGETLTNTSTRKFIEQGVSFIPEDRHKDGCIADLPIIYTTAMKEFREFGSKGNCDYDAIRHHAQRLVDEYDVKGIDDVTKTKPKGLSGGNLQKLIIARELDRDPSLLVANQPTRGVDVGAIESIREKLIQQRDQGTGIVLLSEDMDELFSLSDRILVIYEGEFVHETTPEAADRERISLAMNGGKDAITDSQPSVQAVRSDD